MGEGFAGGGAVGGGEGAGAFDDAAQGRGHHGGVIQGFLVDGRGRGDAGEQVAGELA